MPLLALTAAACGAERWLLVWLAPWLDGEVLLLPRWMGGRLAVKWAVRRLCVVVAAGLLMWVFAGHRDHWKETHRCASGRFFGGGLWMVVWRRALQALQQQMDAAEHRYTLQLQAAMEGQRRALRAILLEGDGASPTSLQPTARPALPAPTALDMGRPLCVEHAPPLAPPLVAEHTAAHGRGTRSAQAPKRTSPEGGVGVRKRARSTK